MLTITGTTRKISLTLAQDFLHGDYRATARSRAKVV